MKNKLIIFSLMAFIVAYILSACNSSDKKSEESEGYKDSLAQSTNTLTDTISTGKTDWEKFKADANDKIRQNEDSIQVVKKRIAKEDVKIKGQFNKEIARLEEKNNEMKAKLTDYKDEGKDKLAKFRTDFDNSMDTLGTNIKDFFKSNRK